MSNSSLTPEEKKIKSLTESSKEKTTSFIFNSEFIPGNDELRIRQFSKDHQDVPFTKGAFRKCKKNGITTAYDMKNHSQLIYNSVSCVFSSGIAGFLLYTFLRSIDYLTSNNVKTYAGMFFVGGASLGMMFSTYKFSQFNKELDAKYSAIWLKSIGKI